MTASRSSPQHEGRRPSRNLAAPPEFFPAHPWLRVEIRALVRFTEVQGFLCIDAGRLAGLPRLSEATNAAPTHCWPAVSHTHQVARVRLGLTKNVGEGVGIGRGQKMQPVDLAEQSAKSY